MNRSKQSKNGYIFDMFIFSCIRVKRRIEREREKKGSGGERRWRKRELKEQSPPQFIPAYPNG